ncbi:hypothetical protein ACH50O_03235 [Methylomonas sp. 2BW1-5-20]|uniref:hypothetical protein n=1 Tax=Methylomonas sp. 2BW1-5-20 TaxID=3376686 RepID=UPI00405282F4
MARTQHNQLGPKSCGAASLMCALHELGRLTGAVDNNTEQLIYNSTQRAPNEVSSPAKVVKTAQARGVQAWLMEAPWRTAALMAHAPLQLGPAWLEYTGELWKEWVWRTPRSLARSDLDGGIRAMLISIIMDGSGATHFILARKDGQDYWVMNPDGGTDEIDNNLFDYIDKFEVKTYGGVDYLYTGICICIR